LHVLVRTGILPIQQNIVNIIRTSLGSSQNLYLKLLQTHKLALRNQQVGRHVTVEYLAA
jgi:hypothetical protein